MNGLRIGSLRYIHKTKISLFVSKNGTDIFRRKSTSPEIAFKVFAEEYRFRNNEWFQYSVLAEKLNKFNKRALGVLLSTLESNKNKADTHRDEF